MLDTQTNTHIFSTISVSPCHSWPTPALTLYPFADTNSVGAASAKTIGVTSVRKSLLRDTRATFLRARKSCQCRVLDTSVSHHLIFCLYVFHFFCVCICYKCVGGIAKEKKTTLRHSLCIIFTSVHVVLLY